MKCNICGQEFRDTSVYPDKSDTICAKCEKKAKELKTWSTLTFTKHLTETQQDEIATEAIKYLIILNQETGAITLNGHIYKWEGKDQESLVFLRAFIKHFFEVRL